ncbi:hypothetical protein MNBD_DELTA01-1219 [hydrothermal vent metagenome]|uniref:Uncharacterized protein n=1 Tax=hydrothermal vent metagenome TaxID=652676 RepID=A0A3B0QUP5_9ZZZZ
MKGKSIVGVIIIIVVVALSAYIVGIKSSSDGGAGSSIMDSQGSKAPTGGYGNGNAPVAFNEVLHELKSLVEKDPNNAELHSRLGDAYFDMKDFNSAVVSYKKAISINPSDVDAYNDLALSYHYLDNTAEGLAYVNQGIEKNPGYQRIWLTKGFLMAFGVGSSEEAAAALQKAHELDPTTPVGQAAKAYLEELRNK